MRAMSRRTSRTRAVFSSWPVAAWKRRLNCSFLSLSSSSSSWSGVMVPESARPSWPSRLLQPLRRSASRADEARLDRQLGRAERQRLARDLSVTPSISNMMRPGLTRAAQNSGAPLPEPMRTSAGFFGTGTSGKMRIHTRPARFMWRVMARRAASIWRAVTRSGSTPSGRRSRN